MKEIWLQLLSLAHRGFSRPIHCNKGYAVENFYRFGLFLPLNVKEGWMGTVDVTRPREHHCLPKLCHWTIQTTSGVHFMMAERGEGGVDGDGDVTRPENITAFRNFVMDNTDHKGVHFMMADGGFSVEGQENIQEILSKTDAALPVSGGAVCRQDRYVVCRGLKVGSEDVRNYLFTVNLRLNHLRNTEQDVNLVVPLEVLKGDRQFYDYMVRSTERYCEVQIKALAKIHAFVQDSTLSEPHQADLRKECLKLWGIPDQARVAPTNTDPKTKFFQLIQSRDIEVYSYKPTPLTTKTLEKLSHVLDYRCMVSGSEQRFLLGLGRSQIYTWGGRPADRWTKLELKTELPRDTLLSVEVVHELKGEGKAQRKILAIHILDALFLNGMDVRSHHFTQRIQLAEKFVKAVSKPSRPDMNPIRVKEVYRLEEIQKIFLRLEMKIIKSSGGMPRLSYTGRDDRHFVPSGLYIVKTLNDPWTMPSARATTANTSTTTRPTYPLTRSQSNPLHHFKSASRRDSSGSGVRGCRSTSLRNKTLTRTSSPKTPSCTSSGCTSPRPRRVERKGSDRTDRTADLPPPLHHRLLSCGTPSWDGCQRLV
ncbi:unnamed protein product [Ranitomeya imitator]|uniref:Cap-specific mRNA (nucleoside-2'-O-)-methyltransferase 1 n=1 Tax=Ranitomeya imitator TaxID=111125 RepID=A0ABN9MMQ9_9NEOB|nr:unnamed protein product [Ranitomeya imitator]